MFQGVSTRVILIAAGCALLCARPYAGQVTPGRLEERVPCRCDRGTASALVGSVRDHLQECFEHGVGPPPPVARELCQRLVRGPGGLIGPAGRERVVHVENADDLRSEWDLIALEPVGVAGPVVPLVVPADDGF